MKHLINREDYIKEYLHISNHIKNVDELENRNENELYEGLLGTLFGGIKMLFKKDWANIKCKNPSVLKHLQEIDKGLSGYTMMKMQYSSECQTIRQNIADYFNDILEYKLSQLEKEENPDEFLKNEDKEKKENKDAKGVAKNLNLKDKTLLDSIKKYKENIATACKANPKLREYADQMLNSVEVFVNDVILSELEKKGVDKESLEKQEKELAERKKELEEERKKRDEEAKKASEEAMKKIEEERNKLIQDLGGKLIGPMSGDKAITTIADEFAKMLDGYKDLKLNEHKIPDFMDDILAKDTYIGIGKTFASFKWRTEDGDSKLYNKVLDKFHSLLMLKRINTIFKYYVDNAKSFENTSSLSVQAMMIATSLMVVYGFKGDKFGMGEYRKSIISKCFIDSDATIGFNLPLIDDKKPKDGNLFLSMYNELRKGIVTTKELEEVAESLTDAEKKSLEKFYGTDIGEFIKNESNQYTNRILIRVRE